jgi:predicted outer membrane protein
MLLKFTAAAAALALSCAVATAEDAKPNDAQIAHIAYTAGQIDIKAAEVALQKSKNKDVRDFAEDMVHDHTAVNDQACLMRLGVFRAKMDRRRRVATRRRREGTGRETAGRNGPS